MRQTGIAPFERDGERQTIVATGHDVASSTTSPGWRTPSGAVLVEGQQYEMTFHTRFRAVRITHRQGNSHEVLALRGRFEVSSEALR